jgi:hypothetical protein
MTMNRKDEHHFDEDEIEGEFLPPPESLAKSLVEARRLSKVLSALQGSLGEELKFPWSVYPVRRCDIPINLRRPPYE